MKQIRRSVFETNSSSTHSLTMCKKSDFDKWVEGQTYLCEYLWFMSEKMREVNRGERFFTKDEIIKAFADRDGPYPNYNLKSMPKEEFDSYLKEREIFSYANYGSYTFEYFDQSYTTDSGENIVAFGYYGYDG